MLFNKTKFLKELTLTYIDITLKSIETKGDGLKLNPSRMDDFILELHENYVNILYNMSILGHIPKYMRALPSKQFLVRSEIDKSMYFRYHVENHIIRSSTMLDQLILFINSLYMLGIDPKHCKADVLFSNVHLKSSPLIQLIKDFDKSISSVKFDRNLIVHRGKLNNEKIIMLEVGETVQKYLNDPEYIGGIYKNSKANDFLSKHYRTELIKEMDISNKKIEKFLTQFFNECYPIYSDKINLLANSA